MKTVKIILILMILNDLLLHLASLFKWYGRYPVWRFFPLQGTVVYQIFWTAYWGVGLALAVILLFERR